MPNHVKNKLEIAVGDSRQIKELMTLFKKGVDFNKIVPEPKELSETPSKMFSDKESDEAKELERIKKRNLEKYGYKDWYYWRLDNWGTKWNAYTMGDNEEMVHEKENYFEFCTAWSMPHEFYLALSQRFDKCRFVAYYADESYGYNCGIVAYQNGNEEQLAEFVEGSEPAEKFAVELWGYETYEQYKKDMEEELDEIPF